MRASKPTRTTHPKLSGCYEALGRVLGTKAIRAGIMSAIGYAGTIRDAFKTAVELDTHNMRARFSLLEYYLRAPGIVGGGTDKARVLAAETGRVNAEGGKMMLALIDLADKKFAQAEAAALAVKPGGVEAVAKAQQDVLGGMAWREFHEKRLDQAARRFKDLQARAPDNPMAPFGLGIVLQVQGKHQEAVAAFQQADALAPSRQNDYHSALSLQAVNDKPKAIAGFERALAGRAGLRKEQIADAETRLKALKG